MPAVRAELLTTPPWRLSPAVRPVDRRRAAPAEGAQRAPHRVRSNELLQRTRGHKVRWLLVLDE